MAKITRLSWILIAAILAMCVLMVVVSVFGYDTQLVYIMLFIITVLTVVLLVTVIIVRKTVAKLEYDGLIVQGALLHAKVPYGEVKSVEMRDGFDYGIRVGGYADHRRLGGKFKNKEFGIYDMSAKVSVREHIVVQRIDGRALVFNLETSEETLEFFEKLKKWTGR